MRKPDWDEIERLAKEKRCLNCGRPARAMHPLYTNSTYWVVRDVRERFGEEKAKWVMENGGLCVGCFNE